MASMAYHTRIVQLLCYTYLNQVCCEKWNSKNSTDFSVSNRVKQGAIIFPILFTAYISLSARILHRAPPRLQVDQNFLTQKIDADPKMRCHQKSFGIWRVTEAILDIKNVFLKKNIF